MVAQHQRVGARSALGSQETNVAADEAGVDTAGGIPDLGVLQDDAVLDLTVLDRHMVVNGREGPYIGPDDAAVGPDNGRPTNHRVHDFRIRFDDHVARDLGLSGDAALYAALQVRQHHPVDVQHVVFLAGVDPAVGNDLRAHVEALVDQILDGVGDLQLVPPRRLDGSRGVEDVPVEHVDADDAQVTRRLLRLLDQPHDPVPFEHGNTHLRGIGHPGEQDQRVLGACLEVLHEGPNPALEEVVPQEQDEAILADERLRDEHGVGQAQRSGLLHVGHSHAPAAAVAHGSLDLLFSVADDNAHVADAGRHDVLDGVEQHRLVGDG